MRLQSSPGAIAEPAVTAFLGLLAADMSEFPEHITPLDEKLMNDINRLVGKTEVDPGGDLGPESLLS